MTREEKQKAIDALKISAPIMVVTQEEFNDYIQTLNKVMDWLEQEPETVTEFADRCRECGAKYGKLLKQEPKWIPVSERLPEENKQVLIQYRTRYRDDVNLFDVTSRADYNYWQGIGREIDVIAWMPLPEPYEPQESEEKNGNNSK